MGAQSGVEIITGATLQEAYSAACEEARYEHGSSYTGTIAESSGIQLFSNTPMLLWDATRAAKSLIDNRKVEKWGVAGAIPIATIRGDKVRKTSITVDLAGLNWEDSEKVITTAIDSLRIPGEGVIEVTNVTVSQKFKTEVDVPVLPTKRVFVVTHRGAHLKPMYPSQAAARAAAVARAENDKWEGEYSVIGLTVRENDGPLLTVRKRMVKDQHKLTILFGTIPPNAPVTSWAVAGIYSS